MLLVGFRCKTSSALRRTLAIVPALAMSGCALDTGVLEPKGPIAAAERLLLINSTAIMLVVVVPVILATLAFAWWSSWSPNAGSSEG